MCRVLDVSESGYYAWRKRPICRRKREDAQLVTHIQRVFVARRGVYGSPRIHADLKDEGWRTSGSPSFRVMDGLICPSERERLVLR